MAASFFKSSNCFRFMTLLQIALKKERNRVMVTLTLSGKIPWMATGKSCCINTWQSWDFNPTNLRSLIDTRLLIFEEYPGGTFRLRRQCKLFFLFCWHCVTCWGQIRLTTLWYWMQLLSYTHVDQILTTFQIILCLAFKGFNALSFSWLPLNAFFNCRYGW